MRRILTQIVLLVAMTGGTHVAFAQHLWAGVEYGMSPSEVARLVPGSKLVPTRKGGDEVRVDSFRFADKTFAVQFSFQSDRLVQVHLGDTVFMEQNAVTREAFERIVATLRRTYGPESSRRVEEKWSGLYGEAVWRSAGSEVVVTISPSTQHHSTILFNFFKRK